MTFPALPFATDYGDANTVPAQAAGPLVGSAWTSANGRTFALVPGTSAASITYEPTGWNASLPAIRSDGTAGLTVLSSALAQFATGTPNKPWAFMCSVDIHTAGLVTAHILGMGNNTNANPFVLCGLQLTAPGVYQLAQRDDTGLPAAGQNGRVGTNSTGGQVLTFVRYSATNADILKGSVSQTGGVGFSLSDSNATTCDRVTLFGNYRPTASPVFGSGIAASIYRWVLCDAAPDPTQQTNLRAWLVAPPDPPADLIGLKPFHVIASGTSTLSGNYGPPSPSTFNYGYKSAQLMGAAYTSAAQNGTSSFKMNPTGWVPPAWLDPAQYPDAARNVSWIVSTAQAAIAAGEQPIALLHQGPEVALYNTCVAIDPTLTWATYLAQVVANWQLQRAALEAAGIPYLMVCSSQAADNDLTPTDVQHRLDILAAARANDNGYWFNTWGWFADDDLTADPALLYDTQHPNATGQDIFAARLANRMSQARFGYLPKEWHFTEGAPPGAALTIPSTGRYILIEESL